MQKTTLELKGLTAKHRRSSEQAGCPTIQGRSLLEHFHAFIMSIPESGLKSDESDLYMRVTSVKCAGSSVCVTIESGAFGDDGKVYDVETGAMKYPKAYTDSMTISSRVVMYQPPSAPMAIFAVEKVGDSKGYFLLNSFVAAMKQYDDSYTYQSSNIYEADDWAQVSDLVKINVVAYKKSLSHRAGLEDKPIIANLHIINILYFQGVGMSVLDGFEAVGEKTTTNKMTMTVMESSVRFSKGVTEALGCPAYVKLLVNDKRKKIAVQACDAKDENAIKFCKTKRSKADGVDSDAAGKASSVTVRTTDVLVAVQKYFTFPPVADDQIAYFAMNGESYPDEKVVIFAVADASKGVSGKRGPRKGSHHTAKDGE